MSASRRRAIAALILGVAGTAALFALSNWQMNRLEWKLGLIETLEARLAAPPVPLPATVSLDDEFLRVSLTGRFDGEAGTHGFVDAPFLTTRDKQAGYRILQPFALTDGRRIMVSRGWVPVEQKNEGGRAIRPTPVPEGTVTLIGALRFPDDPQSPAFGANDNVWIARDLDLLAKIFATEPILVVAETSTPGPDGAAPIPQPLTVNLRNNHLGYAITWWLLAAFWAGMSTLLTQREWR
ncbi:MAG: SURF1 family protein, partial [Pseudomonadota bacterium]